MARVRFKAGDKVVNYKARNWGVGEVVEVSSGYIDVNFPDINDKKLFQKAQNPLELKEKNLSNNQPISTTEHIHNSSYPSSVDKKIRRDKSNVIKAQKFASLELQADRTIHTVQVSFVHGHSLQDKKIRDGKASHISNLMRIKDNPFHAMVEVEISTTKNKRPSKQILYANIDIVGNTPVSLGADHVDILTWTHPAIQIGITKELNEEIDIRDKSYTLQSVIPLARAKFFHVLPEIAGLYEPGGLVGNKKRPQVTTGLKTVKLEMTKDQVDAFLSKMSGMMLVTGAPGSGKTTVAMQRIRFLYDQQGERIEGSNSVRYSPELTRVFLTNNNLVDYSKSMLEKDLHIPSSVVELVGTFISQYLGILWAYKHNAKLRRKKLFIYEERGRQAFWGLCSPKDLKDCWLSFESQIADRLKQAKQAKWFALAVSKNSRIALQKLANSLSAAAAKQVASSPLTSAFNMDAIYRAVGKEYRNVSILLNEERLLGKFDQQFLQWLFWVYDPLGALANYFSDFLYQGGIRIKNGVGLKIRENEIIESIKNDWQNRIYGKEEEAWFAFLFRFSLPTETDYKLRFRDIPNPLSIKGLADGNRWTHVMIDEAQDLCVAEAALLSSFVHPDGAFTVSADFNQVVSPVWGMETAEAFQIGCSLRDKGEIQRFPFAKNMRQSKQIGLLLRSFYQNIFGEIAPFTENDRLEGSKPLLIIGRSSSFVGIVKQRLNVLKRNPNIQSVAFIQVDEDEEALSQYRDKFEEIGVTLAPIWQSYAKGKELVTTSVERIKGLEYDACFVVGMDDIESSTLKHSKNRAYVALSRPALQLTILCEETPRSLQRVDKDLINIVHR